MSVNLWVFAQDFLLDEIADLNKYKAIALGKFAAKGRLQYQCVVNQLSKRLEVKKAEFSNIHKSKQLNASEAAIFQEIYQKRQEEIGKQCPVKQCDAEPMTPPEKKTKRQDLRSQEKPSKPQESQPKTKRMGKLSKWNGSEDLYKMKSPRRLQWKVTQIKGRRTGSKRVKTPVQRQKVERMESLKTTCSRWRRKLFSTMDI